MRKQRPIQQRHAYRIVERTDGFAVYDKHSKFRVICPTQAEAQEYVNQHTARPSRAALSTFEAQQWTPTF
jgi:hypothetical protein